jgi:hypothetical protein
VLADDRRRSVTVALAVTTVLATVYVIWLPAVGDLAAQVARTQATATGGFMSWWTGWFGGLTLPDYSVLAPRLMSVIGIRASAVLACVIATVATAYLVRDSYRPVSAATAFAVFICADVFAGRLTFALGFAAAAAALAAMKSRRGIVGGVLGVLSYLLSPLAGLFLGLALVAVAWTNPPLRSRASILAGLLLAAGSFAALWFPNTGTEPFPVLDALPSIAAGLLILVCCPSRPVRVTTSLCLAGTLLFLLWPTAVGSNITRLAWLAAVPVLIAAARLRRAVLVAVVVGLAAWPMAGLGTQLAAATDPSTTQSFYAPLVAELTRRTSDAAPTVRGDRIEVADTASHWASAYLSGFPLARGWDRQADHAYNPLFYEAGALTPTSYRGWLDQLAVAWVAVPTAPLDYASVDEASLVSAGVPYLKLVWVTKTWRLCEVRSPTSLVAGSVITAVRPDRIDVAVAAAGRWATHIRWSPYLVATDSATGNAIPDAAVEDNGWLTLVVDRPNRITVTSQFHL